MRKNVLSKASLMALMVVAMSGCVKDDLSSNNANEIKDYNEFTFSTGETVSLKVAYQNTGVKASTYFEVYDRMPVEKTEVSFTKIEGVTPIFTGVTNTDGTFDGSFEIPSYVEKVYIWTPAFYAQNLIEATVENGVIVAKDEVDLASRAGTEGVLTSNLPTYLTDGGSKYPYRQWVNKLGSFDSYTGRPSYVYTEAEKAAHPNLFYSDVEIDYIYKNVINVLNVAKKCPMEYRQVGDFELSFASDASITMLGGNTCWNSSLGYYYYTGNEPTSWSQVKVIALCPNTQDGKWTVGKARPAGIQRQDVIQLKYFGADYNGVAQDSFPAGTKIGFVLATNGWDNKTSGYNRTLNHFASSTAGLTISASKKTRDPYAAKFSYTTAEGKIYSILSFEDYIDDENFSDVVFALRPAAAFVEVPEMKEGTVTSEYSALYAFEDCWPREHDYDLNDAMIYYMHSTTKQTSSKWLNGEQVGATQIGGVKEETFLFKSYHNFATLKNGIAVKMAKTDYVTRADSVKHPGSDVFVEADFSNGILSENINAEEGDSAPEYKITLRYDATKASAAVAESSVNVFLCRTQGNGSQLEVHIPFEAPTAAVDYKLFGTQNDCTNRSATPINWYSANGNFPFAIKLAGAAEDDLADLLIPANESTRIDELFPTYITWVESNGTKCKDWYKK